MLIHIQLIYFSLIKVADFLSVLCISVVIYSTALMFVDKTEM